MSTTLLFYKVFVSNLARSDLILFTFLKQDFKYAEVENPLPRLYYITCKHSKSLFGPQHTQK